MATVTVVEFVKSAGLYRTGERAGFAHELAHRYAALGFARIVSEHVPSIDPSVVASDTQRTIEQARAMLAQAERDAKAQGKSAGTADVLDTVAMTRAMITSLEKRLAEAGELPLPGEIRRAPASQAAA